MVFTGASHNVTIGTKADTIDVVGVAYEAVNRLARCDIPDAHGVVLAAAGETLAVGAETQAMHGTPMSVHGANFLACVRIQKTHDGVATYGKLAAVWAEAQSIDLGPVSSNSECFLSCPSIPQPNHLDSLVPIRTGTGQA